MKTGAGGTKEAPTYTTKDGLVLRLRAVKPLVVDRWIIEWGKQNPEPEPPEIILENGDPWRNPGDEWYQILIRRRESKREKEMSEWLISAGVRDNPPPDWEPILADSTDSPRYAWLSEQLELEDIEGLVQAIMGIDNPTPEGVEEAEKNSMPAGEASG